MYSIHEYLSRVAIIILVSSRWQGCGSGWSVPDPDTLVEKKPDPDPTLESPRTRIHHPARRTYIVELAGTGPDSRDKPGSGPSSVNVVSHSGDSF